MSVSVRVSAPLSRAVVAGVLVAGLVATSGCSWFRRGDALYANDPAKRPLEVPPALELPRADATSASAAASGAATASAGSSRAATAAGGFVVPGSRDVVFDRVGEELGKMEGVTVVSRAQLLGAFDITYEGSSFLVRVGGAETGSTVSAVDPRGLPAAGDAPARLMGQLKAALGGN